MHGQGHKSEGEDGNGVSRIAGQRSNSGGGSRVHGENG